LTDAAEIAELFAHKYHELYTSVPYDSKEMQDFITDLNNSLAGRSMNTDCFFHVNEIKDAVSKLNRHKREGFSDLSTDHVLNAPNDLYVHISCLFTTLILHGTATDSFRHSTILPIPKGHNLDKSDSANFRGIALSSIYGKILDNIFLDHYYYKLQNKY
jgi:hypothetical protein